MVGASERGFTLIELMISTGIFAVVSLAAFSVLSTSQKTATMADQTTAIQSNVRMALDLIARDIRMTGFGNPPASSISASCPQSLSATDGAPSDSIAVMTVDQQIGTLAVAFNNTQANIITLAAALPIDLAIGQLVSLDGGAFTADASGHPIGAGTITAFNTGLKTLTLAIPNTSTPVALVEPKNFAVGTGVVRLTCVVYTVTAGSATPPYQFMRNGIAMVDGIESLQLAYGVDADGDGKIDDQVGGVAGVSDCLDFIPNNATCKQGAATLAAGTVTALGTTVNATPTAVRQVRVSVVGRAVPPGAMNIANSCWDDEAFRSLAGTLQVENTLLAKPVFPAGCAKVGQTAGIRRRVLTRTVSLRNASNF